MPIPLLRQEALKLTTLKPRIAQLQSRRLPILQTATPRQRGSTWMKRRAAWLSAHPMCECCKPQGLVTKAQEVDHVIPLWKGGRDDETNMQSLCVTCHQVKTKREASERANVAPAGF